MNSFKTRDWRQFFQNYRNVPIRDDKDLLYQVGTTVNGQPINEQQFNAIIEDITNGLQLKRNDVLLDLCCGNGVITYQISFIVKECIGIDGSNLYINNALKYKNNTNITYLESEILDFENYKSLLKSKQVNKVLFYSSIAYFSPKQIHRILSELKSLLPGNFELFIGSILDYSKRNLFFTSLKRKINFLVYLLLPGFDKGLGRWWRKEDIKKFGKDLGYSVEILSENKLLHTAHYRFDVRMKLSSSSN